jgi:hypothetical protein
MKGRGIKSLIAENCTLYHIISWVHFQALPLNCCLSSFNLTKVLNLPSQFHFKGRPLAATNFALNLHKVVILLLPVFKCAFGSL